MKTWNKFAKINPEIFIRWPLRHLINAYQYDVFHLVGIKDSLKH